MSTKSYDMRYLETRSYKPYHGHFGHRVQENSKYDTYLVGEIEDIEWDVLSGRIAEGYIYLSEGEGITLNNHDLLMERFANGRPN